MQLGQQASEQFQQQMDNQRQKQQKMLSEDDVTDMIDGLMANQNTSPAISNALKQQNNTMDISAMSTDDIERKIKELEGI